MQVTFKPTNYKFEFDARYFVQIGNQQGETPFVAAFPSSADAIEYAKAKLKSDQVLRVWVFGREQQIFSEGKGIEVTA